MRVDVLGPCTLRDDDDGPVPAGGPRQRAVLGVLALLRGTPVPTARLADAVWSGSPPRTAEHTVANYVLRLRRLGVEIARDGDGYRLDTPTDVDELDRLSTAARTLEDPPGSADRAAALAAAVALVRGEPGEGLPDGDVIRGRREELAERVDVLLEDAAAAALDTAARDTSALDTAAPGTAALGTSGPAAEGELVPRLRALVAASPYRERRWELLIVALYRSGNQRGALEAFARARELLAAELGVDPSPRLRRVQQAVLAQDPALGGGNAAGPAGRAAHPVGGGGRALPGLATGFVGRAAEQAALAESTRVRRLVTLCGPLGSGKTRLALQHARAAGGPVWFVALEGLPAATSVAQAALAVVAPGSRASDAAGGVRAALAGGPALLVLDGAEQRAPEVGALATLLLAGCPDLTLLVTSRQLLRVAGEAAVPVAGLEPGDRRALLVDRARLHDPGYQLADRDLADADRLCGLVDGLPLGIELVARHLRLLTVAELADRVDVDVDRWTATPGADGGLGRALGAEVDALAPPLRQLLARLAVLAGEADLALIAEVADPGGGAGEGEADVFELLALLVDRSLVQVRAGPLGIRYALLLSVRRYGLTLLADDARRAAEQTYTGAVLRRAARLAPAVSGPDRARTLLALDADAPHLQAALAAGADGIGAPRALAVAAALTEYWLARRLSEGVAWLQRLLAAVGTDVPPERRSHALLQLGHLGYWTTQFPLATRALTEARALLGPGTDAVLLGQVLRRLGAVAAATDDVERARDLLEESAAVLAAADSATEAAVSLLHLGSLLADENRTAEALPLLTRARDALRAAGDPLREAQVLAALMLAWWKAGDPAAALGAGHRARAVLSEVGHRPTEGVIAYRLAAVERVLGRPDEAREHAAAALTAGTETGTRTTTALAHLVLARLDADAGATAAAAEHVARALQILDPASDRWVLVEALELTARIQVDRGQPGGWLLDQAARLRSDIGQPPAPADAAELRLLAVRAAGHPGARLPGPAAVRTPAELREWALGCCWSAGDSAAAVDPTPSVGTRRP